MLRFDQNPNQSPRNYLLRREQARLLVLVFLLAFVVLAISRVRSPEVVGVLNQLFGDAESDRPAAAEPPPLDTSVPTKPLDRSRFSEVLDGAKMRKAETDAWFYTLAALQKEPVGPQAPTVGYAQLNSQPDHYRGQPVRVEGFACRVEQVAAAENEIGIENLYRVFLQPRGGEVWPITIYCLEKPTDAPLGEEIRLPANASGFFFKNWSYRWEGGMGMSPVVLAKSVNLTTPAPEALEQSDEPMSFSTILLVAALISVALTGLFALYTRNRPSRSSTLANQTGEIVIPGPEEG